VTTPIIVIPTYWTRPAGEKQQPDDGIFDHPTPVDGESTLPRLLASLARLEDADGLTVVVLVGATTPEVSDAAESRVADMLAGYARHFDTVLVGKETETRMQALARAAGLSGDAVTLHTYAGIRNLQLLVPLARNAGPIIALDDDEIVKPDYLRIASESVSNPGFVGAAGFYEDARGEVLLPEASPTGNIFLDKPAIMNAAARRLLDAPGRWVATAVAFGGNMIFGRELAARVGFDPGITRGEDLDYVLNARLAGLPFWLDKRLRITHLPPRHLEASSYLRIAEDIRRFLYEREKLRLAARHPDRFHPLPDVLWQPYPGRFLQDDLEEQALAALEATGSAEDRSRWGDPEAIVMASRERARTLASRYFDFATHWPILTHTLINR
jgi:hypothetical protein